MAIITDLPCLEITVDFAGDSLPEYHDNDEDEQEPFTSTTYIEAQSNAKFGIAVQYDPATFPLAGEHITYRMYLDGKRVHGIGVHHNPATTTSKRRMVFNAAKETLEHRLVIKRFAFAELSIS